MSPEEKPEIKLTTDPQIISQCAQWMAQSDPWLTLEMGHAQCLKSFEGPMKEIYILNLKKEMAGFVILQICGTFKGYIQTICIHENYRNEGLGKTLLQFCEERILKISPNIFICVSTFNTGAIKLYSELGFKLIGRLDHFIKEGFTELLLLKTKGPLIGYRIQE